MPKPYPVHTPVVAPPETDDGVMQAWVADEEVRSRAKVGTVAVGERRIMVRSPRAGELVPIAKPGDPVAPGVLLGFIRWSEEAPASMTEGPHGQRFQGVPRLGRALGLMLPGAAMAWFTVMVTSGSVWFGVVVIPLLAPWAQRLYQRYSQRRLQRLALEVGRRLGSGHGPAVLPGGTAPAALCEGSGRLARLLELPAAPNPEYLQGLCRHEVDEIALAALAELVEQDPAEAVSAAWDLVLRTPEPIRRAAWQVIGRLGAAQDVLPTLEFLHRHPYPVADPVHAEMRRAVRALKARYPESIASALFKVKPSLPRRRHWDLMRRALRVWLAATAVSTLGVGVLAFLMTSLTRVGWVMLGTFVLSMVIVLPLVLLFGLSSEAVVDFGNTPVTLKSGEKQEYAGQLAIASEGGEQGQLSDATPKGP